MFELFLLVAANVTLDELMSQLLHAVEVFQEQQRTEVAEEVRRRLR